eukprot:2800463-Rhodomonas_salina.2
MTTRSALLPTQTRIDGPQAFKFCHCARAPDSGQPAGDFQWRFAGCQRLEIRPETQTEFDSESSVVVIWSRHRHSAWMRYGTALCSLCSRFHPLVSQLAERSAAV